MSFDLPDETSTLYRYVRRFDRWLTKLRHTATSRQPMMGFQWILLTFLLVIPALAIIFFLIQCTHTRYVLLTGPAGSTTAQLAPRLQTILNEPDPIERFLHLNIVPDFELRPSCGAFDSIAQLNAGIAHLGFAEDGLPEGLVASSHCALSPATVQEMSPTLGTDAKIRVVTLLYKSPLQIVARAKLGVKDLQDLSPGTKVYLGPDGSATNFVSQRILDHLGVQVERHGRNLDFNQAAKGLLEGQFDVAFFLMGLKAEVLTDLLLRHPEMQLLPIEQAASLKMLFPYLEPLTIPAAIYPNTAHEIHTVGTNTVLVASDGLREAEVYATTKKIADHAQNLLRDIPLSYAREIDNDPKKDLFYPVHDGAHRFFTHDPPFFLDLRTLAGVGTYFSVVSAFTVMLLQFLRHYRVHRLLMALDLILERSQQLGTLQGETRLLPHMQKVRRVALRLMRRRKITYDEFSRIEDYVKAHHL
ncbi:MAG: TAXI family TRAP transporter solute-binding subunit [Nitrospira sp.]|jgi:hypothetical protein|nr:TAXI family TRAP transporter solute-binding subunit [Nitrospira sp.]MBP6605787.1 TAXI family TRAP transporter solute-binding subunit [Nitrospira sp.]HQY57936.1 TAXI family TRAP transporter solute-binding subunit [Nitrospira sp.]HRA98437.1 TAXI family TRAP transporter solute-binding subunit [Nitrospira sp.]